MSPRPTVIPMIAYADGPAAMDWLAEAFGFEETTRWLDDEGRLTHGEMRTGDGQVDGEIMLATPTPEYQGPSEHRRHCPAADAWLGVPWVVDGVLVYVADLEAHYAQTKAAGAPLLSGIEDTGVGRLYRTEDVEGHRWMFMQRNDD